MVEVEEEKILKLFDSYWFENSLVTKKPEEKCQRLPTLRLRSMSDQNLNSSSFKKAFLGNEVINTINSDDNFSLCSYESDISPTSVLPTSVLPVLPKLETIQSGKEVDHNYVPGKLELPKRKLLVRSKKKKGKCRSFSELEFEELKGFMDMGFVFNDEAKRNSSLVSLIPGLREKSTSGNENDEEDLKKPYLSEAWSVLEERKPNKSLMMNMRIKSCDLKGNEIYLKDSLKIWAHNVASTLK
ncbi:hypothetical protein ACFE04_030258 [Oxalis oulophora]